MMLRKLCVLPRPFLCAVILTIAGCGGLGKTIKVKGRATVYHGRPQVVATEVAVQ